MSRGCFSLLVIMLGNIFRVQGTFPNKEMCACLIVKYQENNRKIKENWGVVLKLVMILENIFRLQHTFPNMVIAAIFNQNSNKTSEKLRGIANCW